jgi:hypothetical protein
MTYLCAKCNMEVFMFSVKIQTYFLNNFVLFHFASFDGATKIILFFDKSLILKSLFYYSNSLHSLIFVSGFGCLFLILYILIFLVFLDAYLYFMGSRLASFYIFIISFSLGIFYFIVTSLTFIFVPRSV